MKKNSKSVALALAFILAAAAPLAVWAQAAGTGVYIGASAGQTQVLDYSAKVCDPIMASCKNTATAYRAFAGWQFSRNLAVEVAYTNLGKVSATLPGTFDENVQAQVGEMTVVALWPISDRFDLYGKAGAYYGKSSSDITVNGVEQKTNQSRGNATFGAGLQWFFTEKLALRADMQRYMKITTAQQDPTTGTIISTDFNYNAYTLGLLFKF